MRPDPQHRGSDHESGRIIYLGEVRRRKAGRREAPDRQYLGALAMLALASWGIWITVLFQLEPSRLLTYLAFFAPLGIAVASTATIIAYAAEQRRGYLPSLPSACRRGLLLAVLLIANLALLAAHRWGILTLVITLLAGAAIEAAALKRAS